MPYAYASLSYIYTHTNNKLCAIDHLWQIHLQQSINPSFWLTWVVNVKSLFSSLYVYVHTSIKTYGPRRRVRNDDHHSHCQYYDNCHLALIKEGCATHHIYMVHLRRRKGLSIYSTYLLIHLCYIKDEYKQVTINWQTKTSSPCLVHSFILNRSPGPCC